MKSSGLLEYALGADAGSLKQVVIGTGEVAAEEPTLDAPVAAERQGRLSLDSELLNGFQLGGLKVAAGESIRVDSALTLANGGEAILFANDVAIDADITAHGGSLQAGNVLAQISRTGRSMVSSMPAAKPASCAWAMVYDWMPAACGATCCWRRRTTIRWPTATADGFPCAAAAT